MPSHNQEANLLEKVGFNYPVHILDSGTCVAEDLMHIMKVQQGSVSEDSKNLFHKRTEFFATDNVLRFSSLSYSLTGLKLKRIKKVEINV